jgi:hypothetical protein
MSTKFQIKSLVLGALLGAVAVIGIAADKENTHPIVWEYSAVTYDLHASQPESNDYYWSQELAKRAAQGWEIVSSRRINDSIVEIVAKRPKK